MSDLTKKMKEVEEAAEAANPNQRHYHHHYDVNGNLMKSGTDKPPKKEKARETGSTTSAVDMGSIKHA